MPEARYHMLEFTVIDEAAAFIAALSRQLESPACTTQRENAEIWAKVSDDLQVTAVYLSDGALAAMIDRFTTRRTAAQATPVDFARSAAKLIVGPASHAFGRDDILAHLIQPF
ncbi:MAG: hypothetical protein H0W63_10105 [Gemmatimonadaceae bacterium]|nr:hypothetical protein [Gemmatimonadaceae bacterium]